MVWNVRKISGIMRDGLTSSRRKIAKSGAKDHLLARVAR